ncbi:MAG: amidohydrolase family protein [Deltaproteobacteria bacterium]|nr:amidohydrolase family protein [Deltaproteobacteria bacterium]
MAASKIPLVIKGGRLIDGNGAQPVDNSTIVIEGNQIRRVASGKDIPFPKEARVIDAAGKTILPGLIDNHVHYRNHLGELFLAHGITSVRDLGNPLDWILAQRDAAAMGKIAGPRIFCAGGGFYARATAEHHMVPADPDQARKMSRSLIDMGVDYLKIHLGVSLEVTRAISEEARAVGMKLLAHIDTSIIPYADAGVDGVEHASGCAEATIRSEEGRKKLASIKLWLAKFLAPWALAEREHFSEVTSHLAEKGTVIEPTSVLWGASQGMREEWERVDYALVKSPGLSYITDNERLLWLDHYYLAYGVRAKEEPRQDAVIGNRYSIYGIYPEDQLREGYKRLGEFLCQLVKAGGHVVTGTDAPAVVPGISLHREMEFLVTLGLTPMQVIMAATKIGADYLGKGKDLGTIEEGKLADLVIIKGDPLKNIRETRNIETVIKDGEIVDRSYHANFSNPIRRPHDREFYGYPVPRLDAATPTQAFMSDPDIVLTLKGKDFFPDSVVCFGGSPVFSSFVSQNELEAKVPSHLLRVGTIPICVVNPKPHELMEQGATSNRIPFIVRFSSR